MALRAAVAAPRGLRRLFSTSPFSSSLNPPQRPQAEPSTNLFVSGTIKNLSFSFRFCLFLISNQFIFLNSSFCFGHFVWTVCCLFVVLMETDFPECDCYFKIRCQNFYLFIWKNLESIQLVAWELMLALFSLCDLGMFGIEVILTFNCQLSRISRSIHWHY